MNLCNKAAFPYNHIEDNDEFISCLSGNWRVILNLDITELREKAFNPFELNCEEKQSPLQNSDPDIHYYNLICNKLASDDYYLEGTFNEICNKMSFSSKCFSMIHFDARSLKNCKHLKYSWVIFALSLQLWLSRKPGLLAAIIPCTI